MGGAITQNYGPGMEIEGEVRAFEPGRRFVFAAAGGGPGLAFEFLVEAATGGGTIVRLINSGFLSDGEWDGEWDGEYDSMTEGWKAFLVVLKTYLERSAGLPAESVQTGGHTADPVAAWRLLLGPEGLGAGDAADITPAERLSLAPASGPPLAGVVEHFTGGPDRPGILVLRLEGDLAPATLLAAVEGPSVSVWFCLYGDAAGRAHDLREAWGAWMADHLPPPAP